MTTTQLAATTTMAEAEHIKAEALKVQAEIAAATRQAESKAAEHLRSQLDDAGQPAVATDLIDTNLVSMDIVVSPQILEAALPSTEQAAETTRRARATIADILRGADDRLMVITGPCSIHNADEALEYATAVKKWREKYGDRLEIIMRTYYEKPRTELGWKGLVYDPLLDGSDDINLGLVLSRMVALGVAGMGVPTATERLKVLTPQYTNGLIAYDCIGARTVTNQGSRELASGTSSPVGLKNSLASGGQSVLDAVNAIVSVNNPHSFLGIDMSGLPANVRTRGNKLAHLILRGDADGPNYSKTHVAAAVKQLQGRGLLEAIVIDASHGNSGKVAANQARVVEDVASQVADGQAAIKGVMLESNLKHGRQDVVAGRDIEHGVSITDECIDIAETEALLETLAQAVDARRAKTGN